MMAERAKAAERAVYERHLRRVWGLPCTVLGRDSWPPALGPCAQRRWNYWWQAQLLDCLVDAQLRQPSAERKRMIGRFVRSIWLRNRGTWTNDYYDDVAWLGLALQRVAVVTGLDVSRARKAISTRLYEGWTPDGGGGIWWRRGDKFKNVPANGPAAIFHAREGALEQARALTEWMADRLLDPVTGLVFDGVRVDTGEIVKDMYTYCQGVFLGACLEVHTASKLDSGSGVGSESDVCGTARMEQSVRAVAAHCAPDGVLGGQGSGDGGLFAGILARYLALAAVKLTGSAVALTARSLVLASAEACWNGATEGPGGPLFSANWAEPAPSLRMPVGHPARDLSVQLGAWLLFEAAATLG